MVFQAPIKCTSTTISRHQGTSSSCEYKPIQNEEYPELSSIPNDDLCNTHRDLSCDDNQSLMFWFPHSSHGLLLWFFKHIYSVRHLPYISSEGHLLHFNKFPSKSGSQMTDIHESLYWCFGPLFIYEGFSACYFNKYCMICCLTVLCLGILVWHV